MKFGHCVRLSAVLFLWLFLTSLMLSYVPKITWQGSPEFKDNIYHEMNFKERVSSLFYKWDAVNYSELALKGYPTLGLEELSDSSNPQKWSYAFYPGWPMLLKSISSIFKVSSQSGIVFVSIGLNFMFCVLALWTWTQALSVHLKPHQMKLFAFSLLFYPTSIFYITPYPEIAFIALLGICTMAVNRARYRNWLYPALIALIFLKHAGLAVALAFPLWLSLKHKKLHLASMGAWLIGFALVLLFYTNKTGRPFVWFEAQALWGRGFGWPWAIWQDLHGKGVELVIYVAWVFVAPIYFLRKYIASFAVQAKTTFKQNFNLILNNQNHYSLYFLICSAVFVPIWFGSSTASIYRIVVLGTPALLLPSIWVATRGRRVLFFYLLTLILLNLHATYRFIAGLYLA